MQMLQTIKTLQWNIGAGKIRNHDADPIITASYKNEGLGYVINHIRREDPDIITIQEAHSDEKLDQIELIARRLGYKYYVSDIFSESHIEKGQNLGQGIISRFPLCDHIAQTFLNPKYKVTWRNGEKAVSHEKGITSCSVQINDIQLGVKTLHLVPFDPFQVDPLSESAKQLFKDISKRMIDKNMHSLIQGDFNLGHRNPSVRELMPNLGDMGLIELPLSIPTIPYGEWPDRIIYKNLTPVNVKVINNVLSDHYPVVVTFGLFA